MKKKLNIVATIKDGLAIALVNFVSLIVVTVLYVLTVWIPYLNVGTTIAMCSLPAEMAKGNMVNPLFIFQGKYRKNMGEYFILMALMSGAISVGFLFMFIPGIVIGVAWSFATVLFVDKDMPALDALRASNDLTYGNKWRIFIAEALMGLALGICVSIVSGLFGIGDVRWLEAIGTIISVVIILFMVPAIYGVEASIYKQLTTGEFLDDAPVAAPAEEPKEPVSPAPAEDPKAPATPAEEPAEKPAKKAVKKAAKK